MTAEVEGMHFEPHTKDGISISLPSEEDTFFTLRPSKPEEDACGNRMGLTCRVGLTYPVTDEGYEFARALITEGKARRIHSSMTLPFKEDGATKIDRNGFLAEGFRLRVNHCPEDITELLQIVNRKLSFAMDRTLRLLRWHQGVDALSALAPHKTLYWRVAPGDYPIAPQPGLENCTISGQAMFGIHCEPEDQSELSELYGEVQAQEPLGHALYREACSLAMDANRSAILILTAAVETAIKMHLSKIAPDTAWFMENAPSPPIIAILKKYIPELHRSKGEDLSYWDLLKPTITKIQKLVEARNKVAHTGVIPSDSIPMVEAFSAASDVLYVLDALEGHPWAKGRVSHELRQTLGWPAPRHAPMLVSVTMGKRPNEESPSGP